jgi:hypothetical protein
MQQHVIQSVLVALELFICVKCSRTIARRKHRSVDNWTYLAFIFNLFALVVVACLGSREASPVARRAV